MGNKWYVSYAESATKISMRIAENRGAAIQLACGMLRRGINVQEVGPMLESLDGNVISSEKLRRMYSDEEL